MKTLLVCLSLFFTPFASHALSLVVTQSGETYRGDIEEPELRFDIAGSGQAALLRTMTLQRIETTDSGATTVALKDGQTLEGSLTRRITVVDGGIKRVVEAGDVASVHFDIFANLDEGSVESCPIRGEFSKGIDAFVREGQKVLRTNKPRIAKCNQAHISLLTLTRRGRRKVMDTSGEYYKANLIGIRPGISIPDGRDQHVTVHFFLRQGDRMIASIQRSFEGDEGEVNSPPESVLTFPIDAIDPEGPPISLRFQVLLLDEKEDRGKDTQYWWYTQELVRR